MFTIQMTQTDLSTPCLPLPIRCTVENLTWQAIGGPATARLRAEARDLAQLWQLADRLRCGLTVTDERGPAWWGCLAAVELRQGGQAVRLSLDEMANQVCVSYRDYTGQKQSTAWVSDADSMRRYGLKQRRVSLPAGWAADAAAYAGQLLSQNGKPRVAARAEAASQTGLMTGSAPGSATVASIDPESGYANDGNDHPYVIIEGRGWWDTLGWTYYSDLRGRLGWEQGGSHQDWGSDGAFKQVHWWFTCPPGDPWLPGEVWVKLSRRRATDSLTLSLSSDNGGQPGRLLAASTVPAAAIGDDYNWVRFALNPAEQLTSGPIYWLSLVRTGAPDPNSGYGISLDEGLGNERSGVWYWDGSAYVQRAPDADICFQLLGVEETTAQLRRILGSGAGQFLSGVRIEQSSGVLRQPFQDGTLKARAVVEQLLKIGDQAGCRLLARIEPDRTARVYAAPGREAANQVVGRGGQLLRADGRPLAPSEWPAGQWARLPDLAEAVFVEQCTWVNGQMKLERRNDVDI